VKTKNVWFKSEFQRQLLPAPFILNSIWLSVFPLQKKKKKKKKCALLKLLTSKAAGVGAGHLFYKQMIYITLYVFENQKSFCHKKYNETMQLI